MRINIDPNKHPKTYWSLLFISKYGGPITLSLSYCGLLLLFLWTFTDYMGKIDISSLTTVETSLYYMNLSLLGIIGITIIRRR